MRNLRWGVLGCANFARACTIPAMLEAPSVELSAVASRSRDRAEAFRSQFGLGKAYEDYDALLDDPDIDAVYNPLPPSVRAEWMIRAAEHGKHTLAEKPFAASAAEAERVAAAAARANVRVMEGFMWRFHPQHELALRRIQDGAIGTVRVVRAAFTFSIAREPNIRLAPQLAGGSIMDVGCYTVSGARYYLQGEPTAAFARGDIDTEYGVDMSMAGLLEFAHGAALVDCGFHLPFRSAIEVAGDAGTIVIPAPWLPGADAKISVNGKDETVPATNQYVQEFEHFSQSILDGVPPRYGPEDAVQQMKVVDAVRRSVASGEAEVV